MKIVQILTSFAFGDAIGNDVCALDTALKNMGYQTEIYAEYIDKRIKKEHVFLVNRLIKLEKEDIIIYHLSTGTELNYKVAQSKARLLIYYHNITPPEFFHGYNLRAEESCKQGLESAKYLAKRAEYCWSVSEFNKKDLLTMGYQQKIDILPILIPFDDYKKQPNREIIRKYGEDGVVNLLFTGRVAPNKKHEDIIRAFYYYKKYKNPKSRLFLIGGFDKKDRYFQKLQQYIKKLGLGDEDVIFPGHIKFDEILAYYHIADVFLCMSEHEGFCVPLVEAMYFGIPILAYASTAIPDTLGKGGLLLDEKDPIYAAEIIHRLVIDKELVFYLREEQKKRLEDFSYKRIYLLLKEYITEFVGKTE